MDVEHGVEMEQRKGCRGYSLVPLLLVAAVLGSVATLQVQQLLPAAPVQPLSSYEEKGTVQFFDSKASEVLGELTVQELQAVSTWFMRKTGAAPCRLNASVQTWLAGPSAVELLRPPKKETLSYLDGKGPKPQRFARVVMATTSAVVEYKVGPIDDLLYGSISELVPAGAIPYSKRPGFEETHFINDFYSKVVKEIGAKLLVEAFGMIWPDLEKSGGYVPGRGYATFLPRNDPLAPAGTRRVRIKSAFQAPAPSRPDAQWLYPLPLDMEVNITSWNVSEWQLNHITFCNQGPFSSPQSLLKAYSEGKIKVCQPNFSTEGRWDTPQRESPQVGRRIETPFSGVRWGDWSFSVTQRPSTGIAVTDIRFRGERVVYELALMDAQAIYAGSLRDQFMYSDSAYTMSQWSTSLEPGVDCPDRATYVSAANWMGSNYMAEEPDPRKAQEFWPICVFDWVEDHEIWRHMDGSKTRGYVRKTVVVRSIATVGNYDYIMDVKFREDGEINVETRFAGYPETRYPGQGEEAFSTLVRDGVAGIVHTHSVSWKADIEVAGSRNALHVTEVREHESSGLNVDWKADPKEDRYPTKILQHHYVEREGANSTFVADTHVPKAWAIVNRNVSKTAGPHKNPRGYRIELLSFATGQVHSASHPFVKAMPWTKYHLAVTKYQDNEYRPSSPYVNFDGLQPLTGQYAQDLDVFLSNEEPILDEDLVAWIGLNKEHIVRQEDIPLVSNFGVSFSLQPWNFFELNTASNPPAEL